MKKRIILSLLIICCSVFLLVGCSKNETPTATVKTPIQILTDRVNESDTKNSEQDQTLFDLSNRITNEIAAVGHYDDAPLIARMVALESLNLPTFNASLVFLGNRVTALESYNFAPRLTTLEYLVGSFNRSIYSNVSDRLIALEAFNWSTLSNRILALENYNLSSIVANISYLQNGSIVLGNRITALENNISTRLENLESWVNTSPTPCTTIPNKPNLTFPSNSSVDIAINTTIMWDSALNTDNYEVVITGLPTPITNVSYYTLSNLSYSTLYTWRITAVNSCGRNESVIYNFTTVASPSP